MSQLLTPLWECSASNTSVWQEEASLLPIPLKVNIPEGIVPVVMRPLDVAQPLEAIEDGAACLLRDFRSDDSLDQLITEIEELITPTTSEQGEESRPDDPLDQLISEIEALITPVTPDQEEEPATMPSLDPRFGTSALTDYQFTFTYPGKAWQLSELVKLPTVATGAFFLSLTAAEQQQQSWDRKTWSITSYF